MYSNSVVVITCFVSTSSQSAPVCSKTFILFWRAISPLSSMKNAHDTTSGVDLAVSLYVMRARRVRKWSGLMAWYIRYAAYSPMMYCS